MVLEKTLENPLDCKEIQPVQSKEDQSWVFFGRYDAKAETPILCHLTQRVDSLDKTLMLGGIWGQEEQGMTEEEMDRCHQQLDGHEFE